MRIAHLIRGCVYLVLTLCLSPTAHGQFDGASPPPQHLTAGFDGITPAQSEKFLSVLAGPGFAGRGSGQTGYLKAAHWMAGRFAEYGFEPIGDQGTYFQNVPMTRVRADLAESFIQGPGELDIRGAENLAFSSFGGPPTVTGDLVIVQVVGENQQLSEDLSLEGKIVLFVGNYDRNMSRALRRKRPAAVIQIAEGQPQQGTQLARGGGNTRFRLNRLDAVVSKSAADRLVKAAGIDGAVLTAGDKAGVLVNASDASITVTMRQVSEPAMVPNVVAWYPGSDPNLQHEHVVIGAHLDHLGLVGDAVYPGADDNGSGSTALVQVAQAIHRNPVKPKRSIMLIAFAAEERGLIGSRHYCDNPIKPLTDIVCMLNMDMVGRDEETDNDPKEENLDTIHLVGTKRLSSHLHDLVIAANEHIKLRFEYDQESVFGRSDQASFARKGVPVSFVFSGFNPHYHRPTDTLEGINFRKIAAAAKLNFLVAMKAADHGHFEKTVEDE